MYDFDGEQLERFEGVFDGNLPDIFKTSVLDEWYAQHIWIYHFIK